MIAFYYDENYYLVPKEYANFNQFKASLVPNSTIALQCLKQNNCLAPYFVEEEIENVILMIKDPTRIFKVEITILTREKYDEKLRKLVKKTCVGCKRYGNDFNDLTGHHQELTLDNVCKLKELSNETHYSFKLAVQQFWDLFIKYEDDIISLIETNEAEKFVSELMKKNLGGLSSLDMQLRKYNDKYIFMYSYASNPTLNLLVEYVISRFPKDYLVDWLVYSYFPKNLYIYKSNSNYDANKHLPLFKLTRTSYDESLYDMEVKMIKDTDNDNTEINEIYRFISSKIGEDRLLASVAKYKFGFDDLDNTINFDEFSRVIDDNMRNPLAKERLNSLNIAHFELNDFDNNGYRDRKQYLDTRSIELSNYILYKLKSDLINRVLTEFDVEVVTIILNIKRDEVSELDYVFNSVISSLVTKGICKLIGFSNEIDKVYIDLLSFSRFELRHNLRNMFPVFMNYDAEVLIDSLTYKELYKLNKLFELIDFKVKVKN